MIMMECKKFILALHFYLSLNELLNNIKKNHLNFLIKLADCKFKIGNTDCKVIDKKNSGKNHIGLNFLVDYE